ncbi:hypothetical protein FN846DRAFT_993885, partial [Sphaerosporella brunnea]
NSVAAQASRAEQPRKTAANEGAGSRRPRPSEQPSPRAGAGGGSDRIATGSEEEEVSDGTGDGNMVRCPRRKPDFSGDDKRPQALKGVELHVFMEKEYPTITVDVSKGVCPICADSPNNRVVSKINQAGQKKGGNAKTKVWSVATLKNHLNRVHGWSLHCPFCPRDRRVPSIKSLAAIRYHSNLKEGTAIPPGTARWTLKAARKCQGQGVERPDVEKPSEQGPWAVIALPILPARQTGPFLQKPRRHPVPFQT